MEAMEAQVDAPLILASLIILGILGSSLALWIRHIQKPKNLRPSSKGAPAWKIGWVNFGIFACAMIVTVVVIQNLVALIFFEAPVDPNADFEITLGIMVVAVLLLQLPMLAVFYLAHRFFPSLYAGRLNSTELSVGEAFKKTLPLFFMLLPIVWIYILGWTKLLSKLADNGLIEAFEQQELITLFQDGGNPFYIGLLVCFAVILAPIVEEIIFRGCIYRFLKSQTTISLAQVISGMLFSLIHANLMSFLPLLLVGILLAYIYEKTGSLLVSIWFHAFFNGFTLLMLFITSMSEVIPQ
ncbi:MAG: membrane protease YdiL (CAAX protease family) [Candidatus Azotimanducaceae bacterium]|jgi:membrane protease YdiL (CAAX protease family)